MESDAGQQMLTVYFSTPSKFYFLHACALCSLAVSITASLCLIIFIIKKHSSKFWSANEGDRLALYVSLNDVFFSLDHVSDHVLLMAQPDVIAERACAAQAFLLMLFGLAQAGNVAQAALSCVLKVVWNKRVTFGSYDWRLHALSYLPAAVLSSVLLSLDVLGPSGVWYDLIMAFYYMTPLLCVKLI